LSAKLLERFKMQIAELRLIPAKGGCFELTAGEELLYSKLATGTFPDEAALVEAVGMRLG
jgi:selT/selW/selH-like putative selenoprotein